MIINLNLHGRLVIILGSGNEALKRINSLLEEDCQIMVISNTTNNDIKKLVKSKRIQFKKQEILDPTILSDYKPYMIITATNDKKLNQQIIKYAKKKKIIAYSSDDAESSDFANLAIINFEDTIKIAIFTGGKSPIISKKLRIESEKIFRKIITDDDIGQIKIQNIARKHAKTMISTQNERKVYLNSIVNDKEIKQLIKDKQLKKAENRAITLLRNWK